MSLLLYSIEEEPLQPTLARVMRVRPAPDEAPVKGFSWGDYEDHAAADDDTSADGDADDVWEEVKSKRRTSKSRRLLFRPNADCSSLPTEPASSASALASSLDSSGFMSSSASGAGGTSEPTKKQRQNAKQAEAKRTEREAAERDRLARLAAHKREFERSRMAEQQATSGRKKEVSGGMQAVMDANGKLVWE